MLNDKMSNNTDIVNFIWPILDLGTPQVLGYIQVVLCIRSGANPTIASYNASVVKTYSAVNSMARF
jgi:hypothetical protein